MINNAEEEFRTPETTDLKIIHRMTENLTRY